MKIPRFLSLLCFSIFISQATIQAQWVQTNGPLGGPVHSIVISGTNIFAGTDGGGVYLSNNNGTSWTSVNSGLTNNYVYSFAISGTNLFAGTVGGVFLSTNNGSSWTAVDSGLTNTFVWSLVILGTNIFAGTNGGGVFRSTNNGASWSAANIGLTGSSILALAVSGNNIFAGTDGNGIFLSTNNGATWTVMNNGLTDNSIHALAVSGNNIFAGTNGGGVFLSTNNGASWTAMNSGLYETHIWSLVVSGTNLFAGSFLYFGGVFLSTDNGTSWTPVNSGLSNTDVQSLAVSSTNIFAGTDDGIFISANNSISWTQANTGLTNSQVWALAQSGGILFAGTQDGGGVLLSTDHGTSWTAASYGMDGYVMSLAISGSNLFAGTNGGGVDLSTNNGATWSQVFYAVPYVMSLAISDGNIFAGTSGGVYLSTNNGESWTAMNTGLTSYSIRSLVISGNNIFAGTDNGGGVFLSTNNGTNWIAIDSGLTNKYVWSLAVCGANLYAGTLGSGIFCSTNNGITWAAINSGPTNTSIYSLAVSEENIFAGTGGNGVYLSTNDGNSWTSINSGLTNYVVMSLSLDSTDGHLYAGTEGSGVFSLLLSSVISTGTIGGTVYNDRNYSHQFDAGDTILSGWTITLSGAENIQTLSDASGYYSFPNLPRGSYTVSELAPACWVQTSPPNSSSSLNTYVINIQGGEYITNFNFGNNPTSCYIGSSGGDLLDAGNYAPGNAPIDSGSITLSTNAIVSNIPSQFTLRSLRLGTGGALQFNPNVGTLTVTSTMQLDSGSSMTFPSSGTNGIQCSGNWIGHGKLYSGSSNIVFNGHNKSIILDPRTSNDSSILNTSNFYDVHVSGDSTVLAGNLHVAHTLSVDSSLFPRAGDTVMIQNSDESALSGVGKISRGAVQRAIKSGATGTYRFESPSTTLQFHGEGTNPSTVAMTVYPDTIPSTFNNQWLYVGGTPNPANHTVTIDSIGAYSKWVIGRPMAKILLPASRTKASFSSDQPVIHRMYSISQEGGSNFLSQVQLSYDSSEIPPGTDESTLGLLRGPYVTMIHNQGWNMISLPLIPDCAQTNVLFTNRASSAFCYTCQYQVMDSLKFGVGYWLKFPTSDTCHMVGNDLENDTIQVTSKWNMIGGLSVPIDKTQIHSIPAGLIASPLFSYTGTGYILVDTIEPGCGYWVKTSGSGKLVLSAREYQQKVVASQSGVLKGLNKLIVSDAKNNKQTLYFGTADSIPQLNFSMPPIPPEGSFDARFVDSSGGVMVVYADLKKPKKIPCANNRILISLNYQMGASGW